MAIRLLPRGAEGSHPTLFVLPLARHDLGCRDGAAFSSAGWVVCSEGRCRLLLTHARGNNMLTKGKSSSKYDGLSTEEMKAKRAEASRRRKLLAAKNDAETKQNVMNKLLKKQTSSKLRKEWEREVRSDPPS